MPGGRSAARAFPPDPNNLGGVQQIMDEYYHMKERINSVKPSTIRIASTAHVQVSTGWGWGATRARW